MKILRRILDRIRLHPKVGVAVIVVKDGKILFGKRIKRLGQGTFQLPGGHLDMYESWEQCAEREVWEETGLRISNIRLVTITNNPWPEMRKHYITIFLAADWVSGEVIAGKGHEYADWKWYDTVPSPLFESDAAMQIFLSKENVKEIVF